MKTHLTTRGLAPLQAQPASLRPQHRIVHTIGVDVINTSSVQRIRSRCRSASGFTLIEVLVYLAVLVLVAGAAITTYLSLDSVLMRNRAERMITHDATGALERILYTVREARSVHTGLSVFNVSPGTLTLTDGTNTKTFSVSNGRIVLSENGVGNAPLTSDDVTVNALTFWRYENVDTEFVRIALTLSVSNKAASTTRTFYSSAVVRGSYE